MKKVKILSQAFVRSDVEGEMRVVYPGSVLALDDADAGALIAAQRAVYVDESTKTVDTTKAHEAEADKRAAAAATPEAALAATVALAVQAALAAHLAPATASADGAGKVAA